MSGPRGSQRSQLQEGLAALRKDLIDDEGPRISTMRNYRFAILQYKESLEFELRRAVQRLSGELRQAGWVVLSIDLLELLFQRMASMGAEWTARVTEMERRMSAVAGARGLAYLKSKLTPLIEGPEGLAADCARHIAAFADTHPEHTEKMLVLIGRAGALHPFFRSSALLRHLDGRTRNIPVVLLYPGVRAGQTGLSFMSVLPPDHDYRPRIYP